VVGRTQAHCPDSPPPQDSIDGHHRITTALTTSSRAPHCRHPSWKDGRHAYSVFPLMSEYRDTASTRLEIPKNSVSLGTSATWERGEAGAQGKRVKEDQKGGRTEQNRTEEWRRVEKIK